MFSYEYKETRSIIKPTLIKIPNNFLKKSNIRRVKTRKVIFNKKYTFRRLYNEFQDEFLEIL